MSELVNYLLRKGERSIDVLLSQKGDFFNERPNSGQGLVEIRFSVVLNDVSADRKRKNLFLTYIDTQDIDTMARILHPEYGIHYFRLGAPVSRSKEIEILQKTMDVLDDLDPRIKGEPNAPELPFKIQNVGNNRYDLEFMTKFYTFVRNLKR